MQGIYTYIPETNHVPREYSVAAILSLLFMVSISIVPALDLLYFYVSTFRSRCAVPSIAVFCSSPKLHTLISFVYDRRYIKPQQLTESLNKILITYGTKKRLILIGPVSSYIRRHCTLHRVIVLNSNRHITVQRFMLVVSYVPVIQWLSLKLGDRDLLEN